jgi:hypothetical protein
MDRLCINLLLFLLNGFVFFEMSYNRRVEETLLTIQLTGVKIFELDLLREGSAQMSEVCEVMGFFFRVERVFYLLLVQLKGPYTHLLTKRLGGGVHGNDVHGDIIE